MAVSTKYCGNAVKFTGFHLQSLQFNASMESVQGGSAHRPWYRGEMQSAIAIAAANREEEER